MNPCNEDDPWNLGSFNKRYQMFFLDISAGCADFMYNDGSELYKMLHRADMELYNARKIRRESVIRPDRK
jgi:GGDEF domain-containing protein